MKKMSEYSMRNANGGKQYWACCTCKDCYHTAYGYAFSQAKAIRNAKLNFAEHFAKYGAPHFYVLEHN